MLVPATQRSAFAIWHAGVALALGLGLLTGCFKVGRGDAASSRPKPTVASGQNWEPAPRRTASDPRTESEDAGIGSADPAEQVAAAGARSATAGALATAAGSTASGAFGVAGGAGMAAGGAGSDGHANIPVEPACARENLRSAADAYFAALSSGKSSALKLSAAVRYTEDGQEQALPFENGWLTRPRPTFTRHVLDELNCSSLTEAVLDNFGTRYIVAVRLRYVRDELCEIEVHVAPQNFMYYAPDAIIVTGSDEWLQPLADDKRMTAASLVSAAAAFFDPALAPRARPAVTPGCIFRLNGGKFGQDGSCVPPSAAPAGLRYPVADVSTGVVTAIGSFDGSLMAFLIKVQDGAVHRVDAVGGAASQTTGW